MERSVAAVPAVPGSSFNRKPALEGGNQVQGGGGPRRLAQSGGFWARCGSPLVWIACVFCAQAAVAAETPKSERHVVVVVWDGMRPDFVSQVNTPALWKLANDGVVFRNHHAVYPSATNVNVTAIATGAYPGHSGLIANHDYRPEIDNRKSLDVEIPAVVEKGDELSGGQYILIPTIAEIVQRAGGRTAIATAKTVGLLLDRQVDPGHPKNCVTLFAGQSLPRHAP